MSDMLYMQSGNNLPQRIHGAYVADDEVHKVVANWKDRGGEPQYIGSSPMVGGTPKLGVRSDGEKYECPAHAKSITAVHSMTIVAATPRRMAWWPTPWPKNGWSSST